MAKEIVVFLCFISVAFSVQLGGWETGKTNDMVVEGLAQYAVQEIDAQSNSMFRSKLVKLTKVEQKIVSGTLYKLTFDLGRSDCRKNDVKVLDECKVTEVEECNVQIWFQPWLIKGEAQKVEKFKCQPKKVKVEHLPLPKSGRLIGGKEDYENAAKKVNESDKPLLGGDGHDIGNYGTFLAFKTTFNKKYANKQEEIQRFNIFRTNMKTARKLQDKEKGTATYGATKFADLTAEEFKKFLGFRPDLQRPTPNMKQAEIPNVDIPTSFDWRDHNAVTPVKNQGSCGSCWAFSTTGNIEGVWALRKGKLLSLSEQELVDCDKVDDGCEGGLPSNAFEQIIKLGGLETESDYPYAGSDDKCKFAKTEAKVDIAGYVNISSNEAEMAAWLVKNGPISIGINAMAMQFYFGGVSHPWSFLCNPESLDHGVLIVGYGVDNGWFGKKPYWIIKNSWGANWGEKGYYRVYRGEGVCGLNRMCTSATVV